MRYTNLLFIFIFITLIISVNGEAAEPEQIHMATNGNEGEMVIQWGTIEDTWNFCPSSNDVEYGFDRDNFNFTKSGNNEMYLFADVRDIPHHLDNLQAVFNLSEMIASKQEAMEE